MAKKSNLIRQHYSDLLQTLSTSQETLYVTTGSFYQASLIDRFTKNSIFNSTPMLSARILLDYIEMKVEQSYENLPIVLDVLGEQDALKEIYLKMKSGSDVMKDEKKDHPTIAHQDQAEISSRQTPNDLTSTLSDIKELKESFDRLLLLLITTIGQTSVNLVWLKMKISLFFQYAHETTPEVQSVLDDLEVHGHSPSGVAIFLVNRNLLGYLNFEVLHVFTEFLTDNEEFREKLLDYTKKQKLFIHNNLGNIVKIFKQNPKLAPASVEGLPEIQVHLQEPWLGKSLYQWKEIMQNIVDWPDHLLIESIDINCVIIKYHVLPFILSRVVNDLTNENTIRRFSAVGATFTISSEVLDLARAESEWIRLVIEQASVQMKKEIKQNEDLDPDEVASPKHFLQEEHSQIEKSPPSVVQSNSASVSPPEGGYDDELFISSPSKELQCPICKLTLREPHQLSCCGSTVCQICATNTGAKMRCPCCRDADHSMMMDKKTRQQIMILKVKCTKTDCYWSGELLDLENHNCPQPMDCLIPEWTSNVLDFSRDILPVYRTVKDFSSWKQGDKKVFTEPFYTTQGGYKLTLNVVPNGQGSYKGKCISVCIHLLKGENDNNLPFPIHGIFIIQLLNWKQDFKHFEKAITFDDVTPAECRVQVSSAGNGGGGWGFEDYFYHCDLKKSRGKEYLNRDMICFKVLFEPIAKMGSPVPSWCSRMKINSDTPPCTRTLYNYTAYKKTNSTWWSLPFYSRYGGYKLQLKVDANGTGSGKDTHLSLKVYLLKGENDDSLEWPFSGEITLQILNWSGDVNHGKKLVAHHEARLEYRTKLKRYRASGGRGHPQFISHSVLEGYSQRRFSISDFVFRGSSSETKYLSDDNVCFRIDSVKIIS